MQRRRDYDPSKFDLTTRCPACGYKIPPHEMMRLGLGKMRCPNCKKDVDEPMKRSSRTTVPTRREE